MTTWLEQQLGELSSQDYVALNGVLLFAFAVLLFFAFGSFKRYRSMDATATSKIRSAAQGYVELKGLAELLPNDVIVSPFSNSRCVWYHCTIDRQHRSGKRTTWSNILDICSEDLFRLVDDTGDCIVDPDYAHVVPETRKTWYGHNTEAQHRPPAKTQRFSMGGHEYRFRESLIRPATQIYALGWFRTVYNNPAEEYIDKRVEERVAEWRLQPQKYLRQFDYDADGTIRKDEWQNIYAEARRQVQRDIADESKPQHVLASAEDKARPFILSALPEESLVRRKKWLSHGAVAAAFLIFTTLVLMYSARPWM